MMVEEGKRRQERRGEEKEFWKWRGEEDKNWLCLPLLTYPCIQALVADKFTL